jgi:hypothetical protein
MGGCGRDDRSVCRAPIPAARALEAQLDKSLRTVVDYPAVALDVASYNKASFLHFKATNKNWKAQMHATGLRWDHSWDAASVDPFKSIDEWLAQEPKVLACRGALKWPPRAGSGTSGIETGPARANQA